MASAHETSIVPLIVLACEVWRRDARRRLPRTRPRSGGRALALLARCIVAPVTRVPDASAADTPPRPGPVVTWPRPPPTPVAAAAHITRPGNAPEAGGTSAKVRCMGRMAMCIISGVGGIMRAACARHGKARTRDWDSAHEQVAHDCSALRRRPLTPRQRLVDADAECSRRTGAMPPMHDGAWHGGGLPHCTRPDVRGHGPTRASGAFCTYVKEGVAWVRSLLSQEQGNDACNRSSTE